MYQVIDENPNIGFAVPKEGSLMCCDMLAIPSTARNRDLAYDFINFIHEPKYAALNTQEVFYLCPNKESYPLLPEYRLLHCHHLLVYRHDKGAHT